MYEIFKTAPNKAINIRELDSSYLESGIIKVRARQKMKKNRKKIADLQDKFYAHDRYSLLIIFQALDAAGKDSTVKHVFKKVKPQGIQFDDFFPPSKEENQHDYLWRIHKKVPQRGMITVFHRSYYEDVTAAKIHPEFILKQKLPGINKIDDISDAFWTRRYRQITDFEKMLNENGTILLKFFLNISQAKQSKRFLKRIRREDKHWKFSEKDIEEQKQRDSYLDAYEKAINHTTTDYAPWYIIPADRKWYMRYVVSKIVLKTLEDLDLEYPPLSLSSDKDISEIKRNLEKKMNEGKS